jgi:hypothetical protein
MPLPTVEKIETKSTMVFYGPKPVYDHGPSWFFPGFLWLSFDIEFFGHLL